MADSAAQRAAAAHAAAHLVYSPPGFDGAGLVPIARTLLAVLEDARVEALAMRELPGLARLWRPLHTATPDSGADFASLLQRLARALADPGYDDPHAWVRKGRRLFYLDEALALPALRTPAELRASAMALGHDIGQARLPFNARGPSPLPAYRDDHRWMWPADRLAEVAPPPAAPPPGQPGDDEPAQGLPTDVQLTHHPEWDRLIRRLRADWVTVQETAWPAGPAAQGPSLDVAVARRLRRPLQRLHAAVGPWQRAHDGPRLDLDALVHWQLARRAGRPADGRVHRAPQRAAAQPAVWLLVDQSASSADRADRAHGEVASRLLDVAAQACAATAQALQALGVACAVSGFASHGRHAVRLQTVQGLRQPHDAARLASRLAALRCGGSTRLGAALRHAVQQLAPWRAGPRWVLLLSDAQAHDIDVHDPLYLRADARYAVRSAARRGVHVACLRLAPGGAGHAADAQAGRAIFGARAVQPLGSLQALPQALRRLLG